MLEETLKSVRRFHPELLIHSIIVDDFSPIKNRVEVLSKVAEKFGCRILFQTSNRGYAATVNNGLRFMRHRGIDYCMTLNSDCELTSPFTDMATKIFTMDVAVTVIGGMLFYPSGKIQSAGQTVPCRGGVIEHFKHLYAKEDTESTQPKFVHSVTGAMQIIRLGSGYMDESFKMAYEDVEFCMRQWACGKKVFYQPHIKGIHREGATRGRFPSKHELISIDRFEELRKTYDFDRIHRRIHNLNAPIRRQQSPSPQL